MRVVRYQRHGGPEVLILEEVVEPQPGAGQVRLRVEVVAGSFVDTTMRAGTSPFGPGALPGSPHGEVVGTVEAVGGGVDTTLVGRRLAALVAADAYADQVVVDLATAVDVPDGVSSADATAMAAPCAMLALTLGRFEAGDSVLVHAAAGSIGHLTVQLARTLGAGTVVGTSGTAAKSEFVLAQGADVATALDGDWQADVRTAAPGGVEVAVDPVGGEVSAATTGLVAAFGTQVVFGAAGGSLAQPDGASLLGMRHVVGFGLRQWQALRPEQAQRHHALLGRLLADGRIRPVAQETVPLADAARAHELLEDRSRTGRVLLVP